MGGMAQPPPQKKKKGASSKKRKLSMAEKRKRRGKRLERPAVDDTAFYQDEEWNRIPSPTATGETATTTTTTTTEPDGETSAAQAKASAIVEAQRASVDTLAHVRQRAEAVLPNLEGQTYHVVDDFLAKEELVEALCHEAGEMWLANQLQLTAVGTGEFEGPITGGAEQYKICPRCIEYVVSMTKHLPPLLQSDAILCNTASMAFLRTFNRKAQEASLQLLGASPREDERMQLLVQDTTQDKRRMTLVYFLTPHGWENRGGNGGAIVFSGAGSNTTVEAKRDRLVLFRSDSALHRNIPWGATKHVEEEEEEEENKSPETQDESEHPSCLVLHLVAN